MKKILVLIGLLFLVQSCVFAADVSVFSNSAKKLRFGLQDKKGSVIVQADYQKIIRLGKNAWIVQKKNRYGLMDNQGNYIVKPKYRHADRMFGKFAKLGNENDYGLYDENGKMVIPQEYSSIEPLWGNMFLTCRKYKYGVFDFDGNKLLNNDFEDIYMSKPTVMRVKSDGVWFEIERLNPGDELTLPENARKMTVNNKEIKVTYLVSNTGFVSGYSLVTATDYTLKIISSISPAYEATIDDLMLSQGADTVSIFTRMSWLPKFPFTYAKKYYQTLRNPNNGPLAEVKQDLKRQIK